MSEAAYEFVQCDANGCEKSDGLKICELRRELYLIFATHSHDVLLSSSLMLCGAPLKSYFFPFLYYYFLLTQAATAGATPSAVENARPYFGKLGDTRKLATLSSIYVKMGSYLLPISESRAAIQTSWISANFSYQNLFSAARTRTVNVR